MPMESSKSDTPKQQSPDLDYPCRKCGADVTLTDAESRVYKCSECGHLTQRVFADIPKLGAECKVKTRPAFTDYTNYTP